MTTPTLSRLPLLKPSVLSLALPVAGGAQGFRVADTSPSASANDPFIPRSGVNLGAALGFELWRSGGASIITASGSFGKGAVFSDFTCANGGAPFTNRMHFTPEVEKKVQETTAASCSRYDVHRDGAAWLIDSICEIGSKVTSGRVVTSGDFTRHILAEVASESEGKKTVMTLDASGLRDCGPNEKPGAIVNLPPGDPAGRLCRHASGRPR